MDFLGTQCIACCVVQFLLSWESFNSHSSIDSLLCAFFVQLYTIQLKPSYNRQCLCNDDCLESNCFLLYCVRQWWTHTHISSFTVEGSGQFVEQCPHSWGLMLVLTNQQISQHLFAFSMSLLDGHQEKHPACKNWVMRFWHGYLTTATCRLFVHGPSDATAILEAPSFLTPLSLASLKFEMVLPWLYGLTQDFLVKEAIKWGSLYVQQLTRSLIDRAL